MTRAVWLLILAAAVVLRALALGHEGLWCDEAYTALIVQQPLPDMLAQLFSRDDAPPLFYLAVKLVTAVTGYSEASVRLVSVGAGITTVAIFLIATARPAGFQAQTGRWAAAFAAVATTGVFHARQARSYSLLLLLSTGVFLSARSLLRGGRGSGWLAVSAVLVVLTHHVAIILVLSSLALWFLGGPKRPSLGKWIVLHSPALLVWAVSWMLAPEQLSMHGTFNEWIEHFWETHPLAAAPLYSTGLFLPFGLPSGVSSVGFATAGEISVLWTVVSLAFGLSCLLAALRPRRGNLTEGESELRDGTRVDVGFYALPLIALALISLFVSNVYVLGRTDLVAYPAFVMLLGHGLSRFPNRVAFGMLVVWSIFSIASLAPGYGWGSPQLTKGNDRRLAASIVEAGLENGDWVVHTFLTAPSIEYYLSRNPSREGRSHRSAWFPPEAGYNIASDRMVPPDSAAAYFRAALDLRDRIEAEIPPTGDVWIIGLLPQTEDRLRETIRLSGVASVEQVAYPVSLLIYALAGRSPVPAEFIYRQDWVSGERIVLRIPRDIWIPREDVDEPQVEVRS